jgi:hypothetical protein
LYQSSPTELAGSTQNKARMTRTPNHPNKITIYLKKVPQKEKGTQNLYESSTTACMSPKSRKNNHNTKSTK